MKKLIYLSIILTLSSCSNSGGSSGTTTTTPTLQIPPQLQSLVKDYLYKSQTCFAYSDPNKSVRSYFIKTDDSSTHFRVDGDLFNVSSCENNPQLTNPQVLITVTKYYDLINYSNNSDGSINVVLKQTDMTYIIRDQATVDQYNTGSILTQNGSWVVNTEKSIAGQDTNPANGTITTVKLKFSVGVLYLENEIYQ